MCDLIKILKNLKKRVAELTLTREEILKLMEEAEKNGMKLNITSNIKIELKL